MYGGRERTANFTTNPWAAHTTPRVREFTASSEDLNKKMVDKKIRAELGFFPF